MEQARTSEEYELFRKWVRDERGCIDIGHSDSPPQSTQHISKIVEDVLGQHMQHVGAGERARSYHKVTIPADLRVLAAETTFQPMEGLEDISAEQTVVFPQTSTALVKFAVMDAADRARKEHGNGVQPEVWYPEGNFRYNHNVEGFTGVARRFVPIDSETFKITPEGLEKAFKDSRREGKTPIALVFELPSNPWLQVYTKDELSALAQVTEKRELLVINDLYMSGTEDPGLEQVPFAAVAKRKDLLVTIAGVRRKYGLDAVGKAGFACSHNEAYVTVLLNRVKNIHVKHSELDHEVLLRVVGKLEGIDLNELRKSLATERRRAEKLIEGTPGLQVIVTTQAGPFVVIGLDEEVRGVLREVGMDTHHEVAEFFSVYGNITLLPLYTMFTDIEGFRINVTNRTDFDKGLAEMKKVLALIQEKNAAGDLQTCVREARERVAQIYADIAVANSKELQGVTK